MNTREMYTKEKKSRRGHRMSSTAFQLLSPLSLRSSSSPLRQSCEIELLSTSLQTKQTLHLAANRGEDQHRDSDNTPMSGPDKFTNCWKENKSGGLNQKSSAAAEWTGEAGGIGTLYDQSWSYAPFSKIWSLKLVLGDKCRSIQIRYCGKWKSEPIYVTPNKPGTHPWLHNWTVWLQKPFYFNL